MHYTTKNSLPNQYEDHFDETLEQALKHFQSFYNLEANGMLNSKTLAQASRPRCGVPDKLSEQPGKGPGSALYAFFGSNPKWAANQRSLTYGFPAGTRNDVIPAIQAATQEWSKNSPFRFSQAPNYNQANIKISFQVKDHGDGSAFDGPGGILAHAYAPTDGRLHYDGDEAWVNGVQPGKMDLQSVGLHELGHNLGLMHSSDPNAAMYAYIDPGTRKHLNSDDITGIKTLYK